MVLELREHPGQDSVLGYGAEGCWSAAPAHGRWHGLERLHRRGGRCGTSDRYVADAGASRPQQLMLTSFDDSNTECDAISYIICTDIGYDHTLALLVGMFVPNARTLSHPYHGLLDALTLCTLCAVGC